MALPHMRQGGNMNEKLIEAHKALEEARAKVDEAKAAGRDLSAEEQSFVDRAIDDVERAESEAKAEEREARIKKLEDAFAQQHEVAEDERKAIAAGVTRPEIKPEGAPKGINSPEYVKGFERWIRGDNSANELLAVESKAAGAEGAVGTGGYLVPTQRFGELWVDASAGYPLLDYVTSVNKSQGYQLTIDQAFSHGSFSEVTEAGTPSASDETYTQVTITAYKGQVLSKLSDELVADAEYDVVGHLGRMFARQAAEWQNARLSTGTGTNQAKGVVVAVTAAATNITTGATGEATTIPADKLFTVQHSVGAQYRNNARWMFNDDTARVLRTLKDANGNYLWVQGLQAGVPNTLAGAPVLINPDMASMAANAYSIFYGDLSNHVRFVPNDGAISVIRLNELYAGTGQIGFRGTQRFGADWAGPNDAGALWRNAAS